MKLKSKLHNLQVLLFSSGISMLLNSSPTLGQDLSLPAPNSTPQTENPDITNPDTINPDTTFEDIFGKPRQTNLKVIVPFFIDGQQRGQLLVSLENLPVINIQATPLLTQTAKLIRPDTQATLVSAVDTAGNISLDILRQNGLAVTFDRTKLEIQIQIPPAQRLTSIARLNEKNLPAGVENALSSSPISGYINFRFDQDYVWWEAEDSQTGRKPLNFALDAAFNYKNWVLEGRSNFTEKRQPFWQRGDFRLVRDSPDQALRYVVGDLSIPVTGYQNSQAQIGISVARNFSLQPYTVTRPISQYEFFLETDSQVDLLINGKLERTLQLSAGRQDLRDLPLGVGTNDVTLVITDNVGRVQRLNFAYPVASDLLAPGMEQFAYSLGFLSLDDTGDRTYDFTQPILTLSHRLGMTNYLTIGSYLQANLDQQLLGLEGIWATRYGNFGWDIAFSHDHELGLDYATRLRYEYLKSGPNNPAQRSFRLGIESKGANFSRVGEDNPNNDFLYDITANYGQILFGNIRSNIGIRYQFGRDVPNTYRLNLGLNRNFRNGLNLGVNFSQSLDKNGSDETRASINLSLSLPERRQSIQLSSDVNNSKYTNNLTWNYTPSQRIGKPKVSLGVRQDDGGYSLTGRLGYTGYRFNWDLSNNAVFALDSNSVVSNTSKLSFGTALVFADGHFAWSRPINNSFALVIAKDSIKDQEIIINPSVNGPVARLNRGTVGVVPDLNPYNISTLIIDAPNLPVGMDLGNRAISLFPTYRSGTLVSVGTDATVFLRGILLGADGEPVATQSGQIISISDPNWQAVTVFTNRTGRFATPGLKPGSYEIRLFTKPPSVIQFTIPANTKGIYDIGTLKIPE